MYSSAIINAGKEPKFNSPYGESWSRVLSHTYIKYKSEIQAMAETISKGTGRRSSDFIPYVTSLLATSIEAYSGNSATASIAESNEFDLMYQTPYSIEEHDRQNEAIITHMKDTASSAEIDFLSNYLRNNVTIPYSGRLQGTASLNEGNEIDIIYNTPYGTDTTGIQNEAIIKHRHNISGSVEIEQLKENFKNEATIPYSSSLHSTASVNENLSLDVVLGILQPPQSILAIDALKDTYTRQSRPYNNYGYLHSLATGMASEGEFITYIEFDLTQLIQIKDQAIISIDFNINLANDTFGFVNVYECFSSWNEGFLMWVNTMNYSEDPLFSFTAGPAVDITELLKEYIETGKNKLSLVLKSNEFITFQSKESGAPPQIIITYADPAWVGFIQEASHYCNAIIMSDTRKVFHSIFSVLHKNLQPASAVLREKGLKDSEGVIVNPLIGGRADIVANTFGFNSTAMIMNTSDMASSFDKNNSENSSTVDILMRNRFASFADIAPGQAYDWREHSALIKATASFADSFAILLEKILTHGSAQIKPYNEVGGSANLISPYTHNEVTITTFRNLASEVTIGNLEGTDIFAEASIKHRTDLPSTGIITGEIFADNIAEAIIRPSDALNIYSHVFIKELSLLDSFGQITNHDLNHIPSSAIVREYYQYHHYNTALIKEFVHFGGEAGILRVDGSNEYSTAYIMLPETMDHNAEAYLHEIRVFENEAMLNELRHLVSDAIVRRNGEVDLQALSDILRISDNTSVADLRRIAQIIGTAIIREEGIRLHENEAYLNGWHPFDTGFFANIFATGSFKHSYATIRSDARMWTPPAALGKLPRIWRWEDFLPPA